MSGTGLPGKMLSVCFRSVDSGMVFFANAIISSLKCHHTENCIRGKKEIHIYSFISKIYINYGLLHQKNYCNMKSLYLRLAFLLKLASEFYYKIIQMYRKIVL